MNAQVPDDNANHILLVDDDKRIRDLLSRLLKENGYRVTAAAHAAEARTCLSGLEFDLIILDVMMPGETGLELAVSLRQDSSVPILMLTARSEAPDRIAGLEAGVDDYLSKPFEPRELMLRIAAILRRGNQQPVIVSEEIRFGPFSFNSSRGELKNGEAMVRLTDREKQILSIFAEQPGATVPRHKIVGDDSGLGERTVDVQINRLRRKIETDPGNPIYLQTVRGIGYRLACD
ncbi:MULTISPECIES: response regulator [Stappiaceae]|jgi:two-component system phosphate regulon response regulator OmpR|uniref:Transcriptional regulatory protein OmpR n=1 Tax=Roseibium aggregatum TaxID=187304 RepID=A0A0M6Y2T1_9HYPH|nr:MULTISPECIES: response regulator transcription factor [Stappiaceae]MCR9281000.1 response regulator transcription factor [Paracoccaceae bacterium]MEC9404378.1 response regulator transcription factor [Pseudomonadota bacterium]AMN52302.1 chemotaxis protein CheY [Labrenzia sp. CP4]ERP98567.1 chemotaxis protein CheY [Labrenzia sp. C1B10]ERR00073.1 chemotaxis protein CheY [Labrenzia sp. C1B70]